MKNHYSYIDFTGLLLDHFSQLKIDEIDAFLLITINYLKKINNIVTPEHLKNHLTLSEKEIDTKIANLLSKKLISFGEEGRNYTLSTNPTIELLINKINKTKNKANNEIYALFEKELGRALSSTEVDLINQWHQKNYEKDEIIAAWCLAVSVDKATIQYTDGILNKNAKQTN